MRRVVLDTGYEGHPDPEPVEWSLEQFVVIIDALQHYVDTTPGDAEPGQIETAKDLIREIQGFGGDGWGPR